MKKDKFKARQNPETGIIESMNLPAHIQNISCVIDNELYEVVSINPFTGEEVRKDINATNMNFWNWAGGMLIQEAFPHLSADDREFLQTGILPEQWDAMFSEEEK